MTLCIDSTGDDEFVGQIQVELVSLASGALVDQWFDLKRRTFKDRANQGRIHLRMQRSTSESSGFLRAYGIPSSYIPRRVDTGDLLLFNTQSVLSAGLRALTRYHFFSTTSQVNLTAISPNVDPSLITWHWWCASGTTTCPYWRARRVACACTSTMGDSPTAPATPSASADCFVSNVARRCARQCGTLSPRCVASPTRRRRCKWYAMIF